MGVKCTLSWKCKSCKTQKLQIKQKMKEKRGLIFFKHNIIPSSLFNF